MRFYTFQRRTEMFSVHSSQIESNIAKEVKNSLFLTSLNIAEAGKRYVC